MVKIDGTFSSSMVEIDGDFNNSMVKMYATHDNMSKNKYILYHKEKNYENTVLNDLTSIIINIPILIFYGTYATSS